jgi:MYXO-CTERM domain-containing protein
MTMRVTTRLSVWMLTAALGLVAQQASAESLVADDDPQGIYGGAPVGACGWPSALYIGGCSGSLVHPKVVVLAAHCVAFLPPDDVRLGENFNDPERTIPLEGCIGHPEWGMQMPSDGQHDIAICELSEPIEDVPIVPILMGCEAEQLVVGASSTLVGFGQADDALGAGPKREVIAPIQQVGTDAIWIGDDVHAACFGDSGGPAYLQLSDGSWRVFGATSGASTMSPDCPQIGVWTMIHPHVPWIEETSGIDITPCHDADGTWNPGEDCTEFPLSPGVGGGAWAQGCPGELSGPSESCGPGFVGGTDTGGSSTGDADGSSSSSDGVLVTSDDGVASTSEDDDAGAETTGAATDGTSGGATTLPMRDGDPIRGCGCTSRTPADSGVWSALAMLVLLLAPRRKQ